MRARTDGLGRRAREGRPTTTTRTKLRTLFLGGVRGQVVHMRVQPHAEQRVDGHAALVEEGEEGLGGGHGRQNVVTKFFSKNGWTSFLSSLAVKDLNSQCLFVFAVPGLLISYLPRWAMSLNPYAHRAAIPRVLSVTVTVKGSCVDSVEGRSIRRAFFY